jgi:hypothetical protein
MSPEPIRVPRDFATWCVVETVDELRVRYRKGAATINRWCDAMPEDIQQKRREAITERWRQNGRGRPPGAAIREPVTVPHLVPPPPVVVTDAGQRQRDHKFIAHFAKVAARHGWTLWPGLKTPPAMPEQQVA